MLVRLGVALLQDIQNIFMTLSTVKTNQSMQNTFLTISMNIVKKMKLWKFKKIMNKDNFVESYEKYYINKVKREHSQMNSTSLLETYCLI
jgi:hypothetical protein